MAFLKVFTLLSFAIAAEAFRANPAPKVVKSKQNATQEANHTLSSSHDKECVLKLFDMMEHPDQRDSASKCEHDNKFMDKVINALQKDNDADAKAQVEQLFEKCAKFSKTCAHDAAPQLVEMLRFSGAALSDTCRSEIEKAQVDEKHMKSTLDCDQKDKFSQQSLAALDKGNLTDAVGAAEKGIAQCMHVSKACAHSAAPVMVNTAVMNAMQEQAMRAMLNSPPVLVVQPVIVISGRDGAAPMAQGLPKKQIGLSLLHMAMSGATPSRPRRSMRGAKAPALIQESNRKGPWVSKLLVQLALQHA